VAANRRHRNGSQRSAFLGNPHRCGASIGDGTRPAEQLKEEEFATVRQPSWRRAKPLRSLDGFATWPAAMIVEIGLRRLTAASRNTQSGIMESKNCNASQLMATPDDRLNNLLQIMI